MPVRIRLMRLGRKKKPFYRIVAADSRSPREGKFLDILGYYNPLKEPFEVRVDEVKVRTWLEKGAEPTETVRALFKKIGLKLRQDSRSQQSS